MRRAIHVGKAVGVGFVVYILLGTLKTVVLGFPQYPEQSWMANHGASIAALTGIVLSIWLYRKLGQRTETDKKYPDPGRIARGTMQGSYVHDGRQALERAPAWRRLRPGWLLAGLTLATFGLYAYYWLLATWRELRDESSDPTMHPVAHALSMFVPIYCYFRVHAHVRRIQKLARSRGALTGIGPGAAVSIWLVATWIGSATGRVPNSQADEYALGLAGLGLAANSLLALLLVKSQIALNAAWQNSEGGAPPFRTHPFEWATLAVGGTVRVLSLLGSMT